jgi:heptosyltransferase-3
MVPDAIPLEQVKRALIIKLRHHGDVLLTTPVFSALKRAAPDCEIDALVYGETAPMLEGHPAVERIHRIERNWKDLGLFARLLEEWSLYATLRARNYDLIIHLTDQGRGARLSRWLKPRWSVAPARKGRLWRRSFTHQYAATGKANRHRVECNLDALRRLGISIDLAGKQLTLTTGFEAETRVDSLLEQHHLEFGSFIHIHPTSRWLFKTWAPERVAALIDGLAAKGWPIVLTAAPDPKELALIERIIALAHAPVVNLAGQLSLKEMAALSAHARLFIGVDSAPMHIAAAVSTPVVAIFGPSGELEWRPWGVPHRVVASDFHPCRPCGLDGCGGGKISECLSMLPAGRVLEACEQLLAE